MYTIKSDTKEKSGGRLARLVGALRLAMCAAAVLLVCVAVAGCGGGAGAAGPEQVQGFDTSDPEQVVAGAFTSEYRCGEEGGGLAYDLTIPVQRGSSREYSLEYDKRNACSPKAVPRFNPVLISTEGNVKRYKVEYINTESPEDNETIIVVVKSEGRWWKDNRATSEG